MRLLVTRPEPEATATAEKLRTLGHEPVLQPLLEIVFRAPPERLPDPAALILTSGNGLRAMELWPQAAEWHDKPLFVTGLATATAARAAGFRDVHTSGTDSGDLADLIVTDLPRDRRPVLYPAARDRTAGFSLGLRANGYDIRTVEAYAAEIVGSVEPEIIESLRSGGIDGILLYSRRTAEALRKLIEAEALLAGLKDTTIYTFSLRIAEPLEGLGLAIRIALNPDEKSLFALLPANADPPR